MTRLSIFFLCLMPALANAGDWEKTEEKDGISVFRKVVEGSDVVAFRGVGTVDASLEKLLFVLLDNDHRLEWVDRLKESKMLEQKSRYDYVVYQHFGVPWPISPRDFVYRGQVVKDGEKVTLKLQSIDRPDAPKTVGVRATIHQSAYTLTRLAPGKTQVEVEIHSDPNGDLPKWLVNMIQKNWPQKTLKGLMTQVQKPYVQDCPLPG